MTLPNEGKKLDDNEIYSINNAVKDAGIQQIHPEKMEAWGDHLVSQLKKAEEQEDVMKNAKGCGKYWRTSGPLSD